MLNKLNKLNLLNGNGQGVFLCNILYKNYNSEYF